MYSLSDAANSIRKLSIEDKLSALMLNSENIRLSTSHILPAFKENTTPITWNFIFGFYIGDGNFYVRVRSSITDFMFIPIFRIGQKNTESNMYLLNLIKSFLTDHNLLCNLILQGSNAVVVVQGRSSVSHLFNTFIADLAPFWFWRLESFVVMKSLVSYFSMSTKYFLDAQVSILTLLYSLSNTRGIYLEYWIDFVTLRHNLLVADFPSGYAYITTYNRSGTGWVVTLPKSFIVKPSQKYFTLSIYNNLDQALAAAVKYRDEQLKLALTNKGL